MPPSSSPSLPQTMKRPAGPGQVVAVRERIAGAVRVLLRDAHDRDLVRADLDGPAIERDQVERRAQSRGGSDRETDVERGDPRPGARSQPEPDGCDGQAAEPEPEHPVAVAADDVDQERKRAECEPESDQAERDQLVERTAAPGEARFTHWLLSDDPHERQRVATSGGKS